MKPPNRWGIDMMNDILDAIGLVVILAFFYMVLHAEPALTAMIIEMKGN